jgi:glycosyltransferase involved in cell wall biosynthesis
LDLGGTVKLLGLRRDVPELLGQMDVYMFWAKPDEGHPVALVEAMAAGVPIMATDVGSAREVLLNGELGDLIPPADPAAMATALGRLIDSGRRGDPARIEGARKRAKGVFSIEEMAANYARVLELA